MNGKFQRILFTILAAALLVVFCDSLYKDLNYFITKKKPLEKFCKTRSSSHDPYHVRLEYNNLYLRQKIIGIAELKTQSLDDFKVETKECNCFLCKRRRKNIFLKDYGAPKILIVGFDIIMAGLMVVGIYTNFKR